ncbi:quaternary ammonium transporter [Microcoleus sp. FACHB-1515]|uniref:glycine betaine ABC transporter substrate-binding protein n=1 Tax=Cyanophyceae TaxID=3028117 RepID=UPI001681F61A|nr:glycine betaine ABC transporter substrate-binding protein [Microcoleus sp. FACHB-1515]MBD2093104.1 quaternary ammonium transporter [Microcoleus sp. FACHB-1515]
MKSLRRLLILPLLALLIAVTVIACAGGGGGGSTNSSSNTPVKVGSKDFTEAFIIGEMYALALENAGLEVERKLNLGGTPVAQAGLVSGEIDLYPEYTGTALLDVLKQPSQSDRQAVFDKVSEGYKQQFNLVWLDPSPMNNTQALAMTKEKSDALGIKTISDMVAKADQLILIGAPEFQERPDGIPGLRRVYGEFELKEFKAVDSGLRYKGLVDGEADVTVAYSTDGEISAFNLVVLEDDKNLFPPYQVAPVVRQEALDANPAIRDALNALAPKLTDEVMRRLNNEVSGKQREPEEVAKEFLTQEGLIKS